MKGVGSRGGVKEEEGQRVGRSEFCPYTWTVSLILTVCSPVSVSVSQHEYLDIHVAELKAGVTSQCGWCMTIKCFMVKEL